MTEEIHDNMKTDEASGFGGLTSKHEWPLKNKKLNNNCLRHFFIYIIIIKRH